MRNESGVDDGDDECWWWVRTDGWMNGRADRQVDWLLTDVCTLSSNVDCLPGGKHLITTSVAQTLVINAAMIGCHGFASRFGHASISSTCGWLFDRDVVSL